MTRHPPSSTLFPYTRSSDLAIGNPVDLRDARPDRRAENHEIERGGNNRRNDADRKSTRLNSSHSQISYAVFCLKKKIATRKYLRKKQTSKITRNQNETDRYG